MQFTLKFVLLFSVLGTSVKCAKILGVFPMAVRSHYILGNALMKGLAEAGHEVTMVSAFEDKKSPSKGSYRDVVLTGFLEGYLEMIQKVNMYELMGDNDYKMILKIHLMMQPGTDVFLNHTNVRKLLSSNEKYDVVIIQQGSNDALKILGHRFNAPVIAFSTIGASPWVNSITCNPSPVSYIPYVMSNLPTKMTFMQRAHNLFLYIFDYLIHNLYVIPNQNKILRKHFSNPPDISDLYYNTSLVLLNSHESLGQPVPLVPNMIQIGGFHVQKPKPLPKDLQLFLDSATEGVIYFSMGTQLNSKALPVDKRNALLTAFGKLKEKVLWKWDEDSIPGQPSNVKLGKWFPQQDVLAHPNVKLFISHGGLLSTTETIYHGVPVLAIPVLGDQHVNARSAVSNGYALSLSFHDPEFSEEKLSVLIHELLHNSKYTNNVRKRSQIFHDRPLRPMESAVYWIEYVIRHKGAPHLRVAGMNLPWYQYLLLDIFVFLSISMVLSSYVLVIVIRKLFKRKSKLKLKEN